MKSDVIKYLGGIYPLQHAQIANLYDVVKNHYMPCSDLEILGKCDVIIKKSLQDNNFIVTRHPIKFQPFDKLPNPPPPRTVGSYGKETFLTKWKASKEYLFSIFNKKKV